MSGYNPDFLGYDISLPLPTFDRDIEADVLENPNSDSDSWDYIHYSVIMNKSRRSPLVSALNIDQSKLQAVERIDNWRTDDKIGPENQLNNDYYYDNPWDKGHMARRASAAWGDTSREALRASNETFYYSNACLQHENLNRDEWLALEDWVKNLEDDIDDKITSFTGPIYSNVGRSIRIKNRPSADVPAAFFKIVCFVHKKTEKLDVRAFIVEQDSEALADRRGRRTFRYQIYQVTVAEIEMMTGLNFEDSIYEANPLLFNENTEARDALHISHFPERVEIDSAEDMIGPTTVRDFIADDDEPVFIAAAMVNPRGKETENEWISITNLSDAAVDLDGWTLSDTKRSPLNLSEALKKTARVLQPGQSVRIQPVSPLRLANDGGVITLHKKPEVEGGRGDRVDRVRHRKADSKTEGVPVVFLRR